MTKIPIAPSTEHRTDWVDAIIKRSDREAAKWRKAAIEMQRLYHNAQAEIARLKSEAGTAAPPAETITIPNAYGPTSTKVILESEMKSGPDAVARAQEIIGPIQLIPGDGYGERKNAIRDAIAAALTAAEKRGAKRERDACAHLSNNNPFTTGNYLATMIRARSQPEIEAGK